MLHTWRIEHLGMVQKKASSRESIGVGQHPQSYEYG